MRLCYSEDVVNQITVEEDDPGTLLTIVMSAQPDIIKCLYKAAIVKLNMHSEDPVSRKKVQSCVA